jgi:RNA polymerase sigma factor for flagellar operon FliA
MPDRVTASEPLSDEAVKALWAQFIESRSQALRTRLIECYLRLAHVAAGKFFRLRSDHAVPFSDYLQYARLGLVEAIDGFNPTREASFETYSSYRIRGAMLNGLARESEVAAQRTFWRTRLEERVEQLGPPQSLDAERELEEIARMLDGLASGYFAEERDDLVDDAPHSNPHAATELAELREAVDTLPDRERLVIRRHYFDHREFRVIARELAVTPGRVSQLHAQALGHIRRLLDGPPDGEFDSTHGQRRTVE